MGGATSACTDYFRRGIPEVGKRERRKWAGQGTVRMRVIRSQITSHRVARGMQSRLSSAVGQRRVSTLVLSHIGRHPTRGCRRRRSRAAIVLRPPRFAASCRPPVRQPVLPRGSHRSPFDQQWPHVHRSTASRGVCQMVDRVGIGSGSLGYSRTFRIIRLLRAL